MIDPFVLLAPVLLLAVLALLHFVGCDVVLGLTEIITVTFDPPAGTYPPGQKVTVSTDPSGAKIYYTTDGTIPQPGSMNTQVYTEPISVDQYTVINVFAEIAGGFLSPTATQSASAVYKIIAFVQVAFGPPQSSSQSAVLVTYPQSQMPGNLNIVVVGWNDTTSSVNAVSDSQGNSYSLAIGPTRGNALSQSIYYASSIKEGSNTVTVTFNQAASIPDIRILEYAGVSKLDVTAGASGNSSDSSSGSATTTVANELIFAANTTAGTTTEPGTGFNQRIITMPYGDIAEDRIVSATGIYTATATLNGPAAWVMQMATFH